jgi:hypothetical protein
MHDVETRTTIDLYQPWLALLIQQDINPYNLKWNHLMSLLQYTVLLKQEKRMEAQHDHYADIHDILHYLLFVVFVLFQPVPYKCERPFVACVQAVFSVKFKFYIFVPFVKGIVGEVHHYLIVVVFRRRLVLLGTKSRHSFIS